MKPLPWSYSALDDFVNCPRSYYEKRIAKSVKEERSEQIIYGEWVHKQFEDYISLGKPLPEQLAEHEEMMASLKTLPGVKEAERKIALNTKRETCGFFDKDVWFRGVIDFSHMHRGKARLVDYKTGKQHSKFKQLRLFALYIFEEYSTIHEAEVQFYWTKTKTFTGETYTRDMIPALWSTFVPDLKQYVQAFKTDTWQPRQSGLCKAHCPVLDCEFNGKTNAGLYGRRR